MSVTPASDREHPTVELPGRRRLRAGDEVSPGVEIAGYVVRRELARGGMAVVFEARHRLLDRAAALKVALRGDEDTALARRRMRQEAQILARLAHPGLAHVHDFGYLADGRPWMALELLRGRTLGALLAAGRLPAPRTCRLLHQVAATLAAAHRAGVVHRDLKPDNVFVRDDDAVKVLDWGIAFVRRPDGGDRCTLTGLMMGTPTYIAPEQARGLEVDGRADVYALGVVAYEALSGRRPFEGPTDVDVATQHVLAPPPPLRAAWPGAPALLDALVAWMLAKAPDQRPTMDEVEDALGAAAAHV